MVYDNAANISSMNVGGQLFLVAWTFDTICQS